MYKYTINITQRYGKRKKYYKIILYRLAFFSITNPMGGTPAITQEASKEIVLYALAILMFIIL